MTDAALLEIGSMTPADLRTVLGWARAEGWNPGLDDATAFHAADPVGFLIGLLDGAPVAAVSVVRHAPKLGFLGLYLVRPDQRGRGYGMALWRAGMARMAGATVGLDGVVAQQANYRSEGFALTHRNIRFTGRAPTPRRDAGINDMSPALIDAALALDAAVAGYSRPAYLRAWLTPHPSRRGAALLRDGALAGFAVARDCATGVKIGPLIAPDPDGAEALLRALSPGASAPLTLDAPEPNAAALALAQRLGLEAGFETARMWRGQAPDEDLTRLFGVASFELG